MRLLGLLLLPRNKFCVGDVGDLTISVIFGRADRLRGCVPSSYGNRDRSMKEDRCEWVPPPFPGAAPDSQTAQFSSVSG